MVLPLDCADRTRADLLPASSSFTGKELDPDFVAANSENHRYHFPARFYLPGRGMFGQVDPSSRAFIALQGDAHLRYYLYTNGRVSIAVDPDGWNLVLASNDSWVATNVVSSVREDSEQCICGKATLKAALDANPLDSINIATGKSPGLPGTVQAKVGAVVLFTWDATAPDPARRDNPACPCCKDVAWKQSVDGAPDVARGQTDAKGFITNAALYKQPMSSMVDYPGSVNVLIVPTPAASSHSFVSTAICRDPGPNAGVTVYTVKWNYVATVEPGKVQVFANIEGHCGG